MGVVPSNLATYHAMARCAPANITSTVGTGPWRRSGEPLAPFGVTWKPTSRSVRPITMARSVAPTRARSNTAVERGRIRPLASRHRASCWSTSEVANARRKVAAAVAAMGEAPVSSTTSGKVSRPSSRIASNQPSSVDA
jgi:hypothetical protein